ncbi:unnamed protein product [Arctogadus glacialis]
MPVPSPPQQGNLTEQSIGLDQSMGRDYQSFCGNGNALWIPSPLPTLVTERPAAILETSKKPLFLSDTSELFFITPPPPPSPSGP